MMKKLLPAILVGLALSLNAQEKDANTFKNEGNEAYKNKDYEGAYNAYNQALNILEAEGTTDTALVYNAGYCAYKANKQDEALSYFQKSIVLEYKDSKPYQMVAVLQYKMDDTDAMLKTCETGLVKYPTDDKLKEYASMGYLKKGLDFYNAGNEIKKAANDSGLNVSDPDKFNAEYARAAEEFNNALPYMIKSYEYDAKNDKALRALENIYTSLEMADKAAEVKALLDAI